MWERYCRGVSAIVFVVDSAIPLPPPSPSASPNLSNSTSSTQHQQTSALASATATTIKTAESKEAQKSEAWLTATDELHALLERPQLAGVPLLVLATKNDVPGSAGVDEVIRTL